MHSLRRARLHLDQPALHLDAPLAVPVALLAVAGGLAAIDKQLFEQTVNIRRDDVLLVYFSEDGCALGARVEVDYLLEES